MESAQRDAPPQDWRARARLRLQAFRRIAGAAFERLRDVRLRRDVRASRTSIAPEPTPRGADPLLLGATLTLVGIGLVMVYSASAVFAADTFGSATHFLKRDVLYISVGLVALYVGWRIDYRFYQRHAHLILGAALLLLVGLLIPGVGRRVDGAVRWFRVAGFSIQPSELAKLALVIYLAYSLAKKKTQMRSFSVGFLPHLCVAGVMALLMLKQPDLGTAAILMATTLLLLLVGGTKVSYVVLAMLAGFPIVYQQIVGTPWRLRRLLAFLDPWAYRSDAGYQVAESLISIGSGGIFGLGLGEGKQKLFFLPASHNDFIYAIIGEELGLVGMVAVMMLFGVLVIRGLRAAIGARELFGTYLAYGITSLITLQALLHMCVVLGLLPTKGIGLPLVSYGGSSLITMMFAIGVLMNVAARNPPAPEPAAVPAPPRRRNKKRARRVVVDEGC